MRCAMNFEHNGMNSDALPDTGNLFFLHAGLSI